MINSPIIGESIPRDIRELVCLEAELKCQICGKPHVDKRYEGLHIHHKDKNPTNNALTNLILLCRSCHWKQHPRPHAGKFNGMFGRKQKQSTKQLISKKAKQRARDGTWISPTLGVGHTLATRLKMAEIARNRGKRRK